MSTNQTSSNDNFSDAVTKYKEIKDQIAIVSDKLSAFEREKASLEGQRESLLSSSGVSSIEELENIVKVKSAEFEKEVNDFYTLFVSVKKEIDKIEELKRESE